MALNITPTGVSQKGLATAAKIPYLLLALAVLALLFCWNTIRSKNIIIAELEQSTATEIA